MTNPVANLIKRRIFLDDKDCIAAFIGERGGGKSTSAISWGWKLDRGKNNKPRFFLPDEMVPEGLKLAKGQRMPRVVFRATDFLKLISDYDLPRGSVVVLEEVGLMMDSREALTKTNRLLKKTFESIRSKNLIVFLTVPTLGSFDLGVRRSLTMLIECQGISTINGAKYCKNRILTLQVNAKSGKIYYHALRWREQGSTFPKRLTWVNVSKPPESILAPYVKAKELFQKDTYRNYNAELLAIDEYLGGAVKTKVVSLEDRVKQVLEDPKKYYDYDKKRVIAAMLEIGLGVSSYEAVRLKRVLEFRIKNNDISIEK